VTGRPADSAAGIHQLIARSVRRRFSLSLERLAALVTERAGAANVTEYAARLRFDDLYLATACCEGQDEAWREFRERYFEFIREFARRFLHDRAAADVSDQVIADLWQRQRLSQYDGRSTLRTWLGAVVANAAINAGKGESRMTAFEPAMLDRPARARHETASPENDETRRIFARLVTRALGELDREGRLLLLLYYEQGLTLEEIEPVLGVSKATLSRRLDRLRRAVRESIGAIAQQELQVSAETLRERLDLACLEFDLAAALGGPVKGGGDDAV